MGAIKDKFFGGEEKKAGKQAASELGKGRDALSEAVGLGREDMLALYGGSRETLEKMLAESLGLLTPAIQESSRLRGAGNVAAQQALIDAEQRSKNAILGRAMGAAPEAVSITPDYSFLDRPETERVPIAELLATQAPEGTNLPTIDFGALLSGNYR